MAATALLLGGCGGGGASDTTLGKGLLTLEVHGTAGSGSPATGSGTPSGGGTTTATDAQSIAATPGVNAFSAQQSADVTRPGKTEKFTYTGADALVGSLGYIVYTPSTYDPKKPAPLMLVIHGCGTNAQQMLDSSAVHPTAEREGFVVVYPDVPTLNTGLECWQWFNPRSQVRDSGDPELLAGVTREVMARMAIDKDRVYALGMSSGAMMTSVLGATYPDLFAAIGENAGCAYMAGIQCLAVGPVLPDDTLGQRAFEAMGKYARVMPVLQLRGDVDMTVPVSNSPQVVNQWLATNNHVMSGTPTAPFDRKSDATVDGQRAGGYAYTVNRYKDAKGCLLVEDWSVHGMGHSFSGGSPSDTNHADFRGPMMAEIAWRFFSRYKLSDFTTGYKPSPAACTP